ncbi:hypothetical protein EVAR_81153_1 [Eumeta japonica]|uniref:Uncharacterized protein n=1 Tax=Eumeta variegata TaxID=151549 RepID=A0A4C1UK30_EUMVA|nr:hypothetical protein EVAR_81153_1 [Eumeta japonica]
MEVTSIAVTLNAAGYRGNEAKGLDRRFEDEGVIFPSVTLSTPYPQPSNPAIPTGKETENETGVETECHIGIRMTSAIGTITKNSTGIRIQSRNEIGNDGRIYP